MHRKLLPVRRRRGEGEGEGEGGEGGGEGGEGGQEEGGIVEDDDRGGGEGGATVREGGRRGQYQVREYSPSPCVFSSFAPSAIVVRLPSSVVGVGVVLGSFCPLVCYCSSPTARPLLSPVLWVIWVCLANVESLPLFLTSVVTEMGGQNNMTATLRNLGW